jgi:hypothetical protein
LSISKKIVLNFLKLSNIIFIFFLKGLHKARAPYVHSVLAPAQPPSISFLYFFLAKSFLYFFSLFFLVKLGNTQEQSVCSSSPNHKNRAQPRGRFHQHQSTACEIKAVAGKIKGRPADSGQIGRRPGGSSDGRAAVGPAGQRPGGANRDGIRPAMAWGGGGLGRRPDEDG